MMCMRSMAAPRKVRSDEPGIKNIKKEVKARMVEMVRRIRSGEMGRVYDEEVLMGEWAL